MPERADSDDGGALPVDRPKTRQEGICLLEHSPIKWSHRRCERSEAIMSPQGRALQSNCDLGEEDGFASLAMTGSADSICSDAALASIGLLSFPRSGVLARLGPIVSSSPSTGRTPAATWIDMDRHGSTRAAKPGVGFSMPTDALIS
jgi:hypothetical protein